MILTHLILLKFLKGGATPAPSSTAPIRIRFKP